MNIKKIKWKEFKENYNKEFELYKKKQKQKKLKQIIERSKNDTKRIKVKN